MVYNCISYTVKDVGVMYCLKCGNETESEQVFCQHCLEIMEQYPVNPGTIARIPNRSVSSTTKKTNRRKTLSFEDQITHLKVVNRTLLALLGIMLIFSGIFAWLYFNAISELPKTPESSKGTNYQVVEQ